MKIQLDRILAFCPKHLHCTVCSELFEVGTIRTLLYTDKNVLQGDICPKCLKLHTSQLKSLLRERVSSLVQQAEIDSDRREYFHDRALELFKASMEDVLFPTSLQWLGKRLEVFFQESQELEAARLGLTNYRCQRRRSSNQRLFFEENEK